MIEGGGVIMETILIVVGLLAMILGVVLCRKTADKLLIVVVGLFLFFGGTTKLLTQGDKEFYVGRPATIKDIKLNKVFVLNKVLGDDLVVIRSDDPKEIDERIVSNFPISQLRTGDSYLVIKIKEVRFIIPHPHPTKETP